MTGYLHPAYAASLAEFGTPRELPHCGGWILQRQIPGIKDFDGMGCYPLFNCKDWSSLSTDLKEVKQELVSLSLVADPFGEYDIALLHQCFKDLMIPFKEHFVVDLSQPVGDFVCEHHQRYARKSLKIITVERCQHPEQHVDEWTNLYGNLIQKHHIKGIAAFSQVSFLQQLQVPGMVAFRAVYEATTIGMALWYVWKDIGYYHLAAYSDLGYKLRASFALFWSAFECFADCRLKWLNLGAGAGTTRNGSEGLSRFKRGWATGTRTAYLCGRIFDHTTYSRLVVERRVAVDSYFPAYRKGEFQ
jgi:hypothetical protein